MRKDRLHDMPAQIDPALARRLKPVQRATIGHFYQWGFTG